MTDSSAVALVEGVFVVNGVDGQPHLLFSVCSACGSQSLPPRRHCAACSSDRVRIEEAPVEGTLHSWTVIHELGGSRDFEPYVVGQVRLASDLIAQGIVLEDAMSLRIDMPLRTVLLPMEKRDDGRPPVGYAFRAPEDDL